jgi:dTDP-glucose 4,6-dehydratase
MPSCISRPKAMWIGASAIRRSSSSREKMAVELGWRPRVGFPEGLARTVAWYRAHPAWWQQLKDERYRAYYCQHYGEESVEQ